MQQGYARGGAWRNSHPSGGPYVCEQCRLDTSDGTGASLTQAAPTVELTLSDVCDWCGAPLLRKQTEPERKAVSSEITVGMEAVTVALLAR